MFALTIIPHMWPLESSSWSSRKTETDICQFCVCVCVCRSGISTQILIPFEGSWLPALRIQCNCTWSALCLALNHCFFLSSFLVYSFPWHTKRVYASYIECVCVVHSSVHVLFAQWHSLTARRADCIRIDVQWHVWWWWWWWCLLKPSIHLTLCRLFFSNRDTSRIRSHTHSISIAILNVHEDRFFAVLFVHSFTACEKHTHTHNQIVHCCIYILYLIRMRRLFGVLPKWNLFGESWHKQRRPNVVRRTTVNKSATTRM